MITVIAEHSVDLSLLPAQADILDIGCRGFLFTNEMRRLGHLVVAIDCDDLDGEYLKVAVTGEDGWAKILPSNDPQAVRVKQMGWYSHNERMIQTESIKTISNNFGVDLWDLIKIDIEGSEYEVIMSLTEPPAKQLSIEFHLHTGIYNMKQMEEMYYKLLHLGYEPVSHEMTRQHGLGMNYWDSLFVLTEKRKEYSEPTNY